MARFQIDYRDIITIHDAKLIANRALGDDIEVLDYSIYPYADKKIGFLSSHQSLKIVAKKKSSLHNSSIIRDFFVKVIPYDIPNQAEYIESRGVFGQEAVFYDVIVPQLNYEYIGNHWGPQCYLIKKDSLVFQDLKHQGYKMHEKLFDEVLVKSGLRTLANLHASSIIAERRLGRPLNKIYHGAFKERAFLTEGNQYLWYQAGVDAAVKIAEEMGLNATFLPAACNQVFKAMEPSINKQNVVSHGDLWSNNLMFDDSTPPNCRLVDFQLLRYSPLSHDVAQFLYLCTSRHLRDTQANDLLKYYYEAILMYLKMNSNIHVSLPSWQEILQGYEEQKLAAAVTAVMYFPIILMDDTKNVGIMNNPETHTKFMFHDRKDVVQKNMKIDKNYNLRFTAMIEELVEMSLILDSLPIPT